MGLFVLAPKSIDECSVNELVETAVKNIELWKKNKDCGYLLNDFAAMMLTVAADKITKNQNERT